MNHRSTASLILAILFALAPAAPTAPTALADNEPPTTRPATRPATRPSLPPQIAALKPRLQGQSRDAMLRILTQELGQPTRDVGSGEHLPQWDVAGGTLSFPPPVFTLRGTRHWLIDTRNEIGENLLGSWEMTTLPDPANHGNRFWIGNVQLRADGTYVYTHNDANPPQRKAQQNNFFIDHPEGTFAITYPKDLTAKTVMESLPAGDSTVATLTFSAKPQGQPASRATFTIRTNPSIRHLRFVPEAGGVMPFCLEKGWNRMME